MLTHGHTRKQRPSPEWLAWHNMRARCYNKSDIGYARYGGRGITVCAHWQEDFAAFFSVVGPRPTPLHSLDRKDNNGHYEPGNVRWATKLEQGANQRTNRLLTYQGETLHLSAWARRLRCRKEVLHRRLTVYGWSVEKALGTPVAHRNFKARSTQPAKNASCVASA